MKSCLLAAPLFVSLLCCIPGKGKMKSVPSAYDEIVQSIAKESAPLITSLVEIEIRRTGQIKAQASIVNSDEEKKLVSQVINQLASEMKSEFSESVFQGLQGSWVTEDQIHTALQIVVEEYPLVGFLQEIKEAYDVPLPMDKAKAPFSEFDRKALNSHFAKRIKEYIQFFLNQVKDDPGAAVLLSESDVDSTLGKWVEFYSGLDNLSYESLKGLTAESDGIRKKIAALEVDNLKLFEEKKEFWAISKKKFRTAIRTNQNSYCFSKRLPCWDGDFGVGKSNSGTETRYDPACAGTGQWVNYHGKEDNFPSNQGQLLLTLIEGVWDSVLSYSEPPQQVPVYKQLIQKMNIAFQQKKPPAESDSFLIAQNKLVLGVRRHDRPLEKPGVTDRDFTRIAAPICYKTLQLFDELLRLNSSPLSTKSASAENKRLDSDSVLMGILKEAILKSINHTAYEVISKAKKEKYLSKYYIQNLSVDALFLIAAQQELLEERTKSRRKRFVTEAQVMVATDFFVSLIGAFRPTFKVEKGWRALAPGQNDKRGVSFTSFSIEPFRFNGIQGRRMFSLHEFKKWTKSILEELKQDEKKSHNLGNDINAKFASDYLERIDPLDDRVPLASQFLTSDHERAVFNGLGFGNAGRLEKGKDLWIFDKGMLQERLAKNSKPNGFKYSNVEQLVDEGQGFLPDACFIDLSNIHGLKKNWSHIFNQGNSLNKVGDLLYALHSDSDVRGDAYHELEDAGRLVTNCLGYLLYLDDVLNLNYR